MLNTLIVDDEAPARKRLSRLLRPLVEAGRLAMVGEAGDGFQAIKAVEENGVDLLFLDIQMPEMDGFAVVERLPPKDRPVVVFTTAFDEYALRAFEANAVDYLLKPISKQRLNEAVVRAEKLQIASAGDNSDDEHIVRLLDWLEDQATKPNQSSSNPGEPYIRQLSIPYRDRILIVPIDKLVSVEISEGITRLYVLEDQLQGKPRLRQHIVSYTLDQLEQRLDPKLFMRVHRSALVRFDQIWELIPWFSGRYKLLLTGEHEVIASRERSKILKERLMF